MKTRLATISGLLPCLSAGILLAASAGPLLAQGKSDAGLQTNNGLETDRDIPGDSTKYYGQRYNQYRDTARKLAKIDLDADFNYDGVIDNSDPADNGAFQQTPPGLVVGKGELSKLVLRLKPYHLDFKGRAVVALQVDGINRGDKSGQFSSFDEERSSVGHIKVWRDASRTELIIDSSDPNRRIFEWSVDDSKYPANVPGIVPRTLYVEGISESGQYSGDVRLLFTIQHRDKGATTTQPSAKGVAPDSDGGEKSKKVLFKRFSTGYDHILLTVSGTPRRKEFVNGNTEGVWKTP